MQRRLRRSLILAPLALTSIGMAACSSPSSSVAPAGKPAAVTHVTKAALTAAALTPLPGSLHPAARPERDLGTMDPALKLTNLALFFDRSPAQKRRLRVISSQIRTRRHRRTIAG